MKGRLQTYILMLAGMFFLLHLFVPHHHHADSASVIEHQHIVEHTMGLHDEENECKDHHHHQENILDEITIGSATSQNQDNWQSKFMPIACIPVFSYEAEPIRYLVNDKLSAVSPNFLNQEYFCHFTLRGPPMYNQSYLLKILF